MAANCRRSDGYPSPWRALLVSLLALASFACMPPSVVAKDSPDSTYDLPKPREGSKYVVVADLGSTGSRGFVYELNGGEIVGSKGLKVKPGVSKLNHKPNDIAEYLRPLFAHAASLIPEPYHHKTKIYLKATAGVRLLPIEEQTVMFDTLHAALESDKNGTYAEFLAGDILCPFVWDSKDQLGTISGDEEGFFAALSVNYLGNRMGTDLKATDNCVPDLYDGAEAEGGSEVGEAGADQDDGAGGEGGGAGEHAQEVSVLGAMDLGGSSTQIVYQPKDKQKGAGEATPLSMPDFFVHSYLSYGVDKAKERLWDTLLAKSTEDSTDDHISNPCDFVVSWSPHRLTPPTSTNIHHRQTPTHQGRPEVWGSDARSMMGTGDVAACQRVIKEMLFDGSGCDLGAVESGDLTGVGCGLDGVRHPPIDTRYASSLDFSFTFVYSFFRL
mmetsp:Transcript_87649/g.249342  ORF Transcript_87649/g.249342 Transcript_87649/m.249342 type:complete len:441 (+) Transcript_87649:167-1489(+)